MAGSTERSVVWSDATLAMGLAFLIAVSTGEVRPGTFNRSVSVAVLTFTAALAVATAEVGEPTLAEVGEPALATVLAGDTDLGTVAAGLVVIAPVAIVVTAFATVVTGATALAAVVAGAVVATVGVVVAVVTFGVVPQPATAATATTIAMAVPTRRCLRFRVIGGSMV